MVAPLSRRALLARGVAAGATLMLAPSHARSAASDTADAYRQASDRTLDWLLARVQADGSFGPGITELTSYFKITHLFTIAGRLREANLMLSYMKDRYMQPDGDFRMSDTAKSGEVDYYEKIWPYANGWIAFTAHKLGRFDVSYPAYEYLGRFFHAGTGGYTSTPPEAAEPVTDMLATAHIGMVDLYLGQRDRARAAADWLARLLDRQPHAERRLYARMTAGGELIDDYPAADAPYYVIDAGTPGQFYFSPGYAAAFLCLLYRATGAQQYLPVAARYLDFARACAGIHDSHFAHKVGWGAAIYYNITGVNEYAEFARTVADYLVATQNGAPMRFADQPPAVSYDQSAECAIWLRRIPAELLSRRA